MPPRTLDLATLRSLSPGEDELPEHLEPVHVNPPGIVQDEDHAEFVAMLRKLGTDEPPDYDYSSFGTTLLHVRAFHTPDEVFPPVATAVHLSGDATLDDFIELCESALGETARARTQEGSFSATGVRRLFHVIDRLPVSSGSLAGVFSILRVIVANLPRWTSSGYLPFNVDIGLYIPAKVLACTKQAYLDGAQIKLDGFVSDQELVARRDVAKALDDINQQLKRGHGVTLQAALIQHHHTRTGTAERPGTGIPAGFSWTNIQRLRKQTMSIQGSTSPLVETTLDYIAQRHRLRGEAEAMMAPPASTHTGPPGLTLRLERTGAPPGTAPLAQPAQRSHHNSGHTRTQGVPVRLFASASSSLVDTKKDSPHTKAAIEEWRAAVQKHMLHMREHNFQRWAHIALWGSMEFFHIGMHAAKAVHAAYYTFFFQDHFLATSSRGNSYSKPSLYQMRFILALHHTAFAHQNKRVLSMWLASEPHDPRLQAIRTLLGLWIPLIRAWDSNVKQLTKRTMDALISMLPLMFVLFHYLGKWKYKRAVYLAATDLLYLRRIKHPAWSHIERYPTAYNAERIELLHSLVGDANDSLMQQLYQLFDKFYGAGAVEEQVSKEYGLSERETSLRHSGHATVSMDKDSRFYPEDGDD